MRSCNRSSRWCRQRVWALLIAREVGRAREAALVARHWCRGAWRAEAALLAIQAFGAKEAVFRSVRARGAVDTECASLSLALAARAGSALGGSQGAIVTRLAGGAFAAAVELRVLFALVADIEMVVSA